MPSPEQLVRTQQLGNAILTVRSLIPQASRINTDTSLVVARRMERQPLHEIKRLQDQFRKIVNPLSVNMQVGLQFLEGHIHTSSRNVAAIYATAYRVGDIEQNPTSSEIALELRDRASLLTGQQAIEGIRYETLADFQPDGTYSIGIRPIGKSPEEPPFSRITKPEDELTYYSGRRNMEEMTREDFDIVSSLVNLYLHFDEQQRVLQVHRTDIPGLEILGNNAAHSLQVMMDLASRRWLNAGSISDQDRQLVESILGSSLVEPVFQNVTPAETKQTKRIELDLKNLANGLTRYNSRLEDPSQKLTVSRSSEALMIQELSPAFLEANPMLQYRARTLIRFEGLNTPSNALVTFQFIQKDQRQNDVILASTASCPLHSIDGETADILSYYMARSKSLLERGDLLHQQRIEGDTRIYLESLYKQEESISSAVSADKSINETQHKGGKMKPHLISDQDRLRIQTTMQGLQMKGRRLPSREVIQQRASELGHPLFNVTYDKSTFTFLVTDRNPDFFQESPQRKDAYQGEVEVRLGYQDGEQLFDVRSQVKRIDELGYDSHTIVPSSGDLQPVRNMNYHQQMFIEPYLALLQVTLTPEKKPPPAKENSRR